MKLFGVLTWEDDSSTSLAPPSVMFYHQGWSESWFVVCLCYFPLLFGRFFFFKKEFGYTEYQRTISPNTFHKDSVEVDYLEIQDPLHISYAPLRRSWVWKSGGVPMCRNPAIHGMMCRYHFNESGELRDTQFRKNKPRFRRVVVIGWEARCSDGW